MKFDKSKLSIREDFVFGSVMSSKKICLELIRLILPDLNIQSIEFPERQKTVEDEFHSHGVRFDVYTRDNQGNAYEIEMQVQNTKELPQRARYYRGRIDSDNLARGDEYALLKKTFVIFICDFDLFGLGLHKYEFKNILKGHDEVRLNDGQSTIFLNTKGTAHDVSKGLENFLKFVDNKAVSNDNFIDQIKERIDQLSSSAKWRQQYMDNKTHMMFHDQDIREETRSQVIKTFKQIDEWKTKGLTKEEISQKLKDNFNLTDQEILEYLS